MAIYYFTAALVQIIWGLTPSASKLLLQYLPVETYSAIRYTFAGSVFLTIALWPGCRFRMKRGQFFQLVGLGILAYALDSLCTLYGLRLGGVLNFSLASSFNGLITATVCVVLLREQINRRFFLASALSVGGGIFLFLGKARVSSLQVAGLSLVLIWSAYFFEALGFVFSKKLKTQFDLLEYLAVLQLTAGTFMWSLAIAQGHLPQSFSLPLKAWLALGFVCIFSCTLCYFVMYWLLNHLPGHRLAFFDCFHTLSATVFGIYFFREPLNAPMILGGILLLFAIMIVTRDAPKGESLETTTHAAA